LTGETNAFLLTKTILAVFRLNGQLIATGDELVSDLGLTSSRWQVLGSIANRPLTMAQAARTMGLSRQSVQRTANLLRADGLVTFENNPGHAASPLLSLTAQGKSALALATERQTLWSRDLAKGLAARNLKNVLSTLNQLSEDLENQYEGE
jgi:DNA-binding MarR family transcriptional regulator